MSPQNSAFSPFDSNSMRIVPGVWPGAGVTVSPSSSWAAPLIIIALPASTTGNTESRNEPPFAGPFCGSASSLV